MHIVVPIFKCYDYEKEYKYREGLVGITGMYTKLVKTKEIIRTFNIPR